MGMCVPPITSLAGTEATPILNRKRARMEEGTGRQSKQQRTITSRQSLLRKRRREHEDGADRHVQRPRVDMDILQKELDRKLNLCPANQQPLQILENGCAATSYTPTETALAVPVKLPHHSLLLFAPGAGQVVKYTGFVEQPLPCPPPLKIQPAVEPMEGT